MLQIGKSLVRSQLVSLEFFIDIKSFRSHYGPGVDSASNRNEYQVYFLGVKGSRCVRLTTYHHPVPLSRNLGNLNFLELSGTLRACNGTALPFTLKCNKPQCLVLQEDAPRKVRSVMPEWASKLLGFFSPPELSDFVADCHFRLNR